MLHTYVCVGQVQVDMQEEKMYYFIYPLITSDALKCYIRQSKSITTDIQVPD